MTIFLVTVVRHYRARAQGDVNQSQKEKPSPLDRQLSLPQSLSPHDMTVSSKASCSLTLVFEDG